MKTVVIRSSLYFFICTITIIIVSIASTVTITVTVTVTITTTITLTMTFTCFFLLLWFLLVFYCVCSIALAMIITTIIAKCVCCAGCRVPGPDSLFETPGAAFGRAHCRPPERPVRPGGLGFRV